MSTVDTLAAASAAGPMVMEHPAGGVRLIAHVFAHDDGPVIVEDGWDRDPTPGGFLVRLIAGTVLQDGPFWWVALAYGPPGEAFFSAAASRDLRALGLRAGPAGDRAAALRLAQRVVPGARDATAP